MEITTFQMYWFVKLDDIRSFFLLIGVIGSITLGFASLYSITENKCVRLKTLLTTLTMFVMLFGTGLFMPSTKQMAAIVLVPKIINDERVQVLPDKILNLGLEWLNELSPDKGKD